LIVQVTPRGLLNVLFRHRVKFVWVFCLCLGASAGYCLVAKPQYQSEARLLVKFGRDQPNRADALPDPTIAAQQTERKEIVNSHISMLESRDLILDVLRTLQIAKVYPSLAGGANPKVVEANAVDKFFRNLDIVAENDTSVIDMSLLNPDPAMAAQALKLLIDKFITVQANIYQSGQLAFLQQKLTEARAQLEKSRGAVRAFKIATGVSSLDEERTLLLRQQADAQGLLTQEISHQQEAEGRYARLEDLIKNLPEEIKLSDENDRFKAVDDARQHLNELRSRQKEMAVNYRPDSITMQTLQDEIQFARQQLAAMSKESAARVRSGANPVHQQAEIDLLQAAGDEYSATAGRVSFETELKRISRRLLDLEAYGARLDELELQQQVDEENFRNYMEEVDQARLTDDLNHERITSIAVVQTPTTPVKSSRPRVMLILSLGFLVGLAGAIAATLLAEMADEGFSTPDQVEAIMGLPVLGSFALAKPVRAIGIRASSGLLPSLIAAALLISLHAAFAADLLNPTYGQRLVVRSSDNRIKEILTPQDGEFLRQGPTGQPLGTVKSIGSTLRFFDVDGQSTMTARRELLPPNFPLNAIAIVREPLGKPVGYIARY
jgi:polysaccharide biosynthesis protein PslE